MTDPTTQITQFDTYGDIDIVQPKSPRQEVRAESRPHDKRYRQHERRQQVQQRFIYLLEDEQFRANIPNPGLPGSQDVCHVVVHAVHEEEVPPVEALLEDCHLTKTAARSSAGP